MPFSKENELAALKPLCLVQYQGAAARMPGQTCVVSCLLGVQALELVFYNSSAAESPITQGIKAVRGLTSKSK